jgi:ribokinase
MTCDVVGFGAINLDKLFRVERIAAAGVESFIVGYDEAPGGSAANTIVGLARLGVRAGYIGKTAKDREGRVLLESFTAEGVDVQGVVVSKAGRSGVVMGFVDRAGERALYVDPGVNDTLRFDEIPIAYARDTAFLHVTSFVGETPFHAQKRLLDAVPGVKLSFDPGELYMRKGITAMRPLLARSHIVFPNESELRLLTGLDFRAGAKALRAEGAEIVAVKLGERGCYVTNGGEEHTVDAYRVEVVDTTGAGDAFCAGFLYGLIAGRDLYECGRLGNFVASRKIGRSGARAGLPTLAEVEATAR